MAGERRGAQFYAKALAALALTAAIAGYAYAKAANVIRGPVVEIAEPANGATVSSPLVEVAGTARNVAKISVNDRSIYVDEAGTFREKLLLPYGYTILTVRAEDRFGRRTETHIELVYK